MGYRQAPTERPRTFSFAIPLESGHGCGRDRRDALAAQIRSFLAEATTNPS